MQFHAITKLLINYSFVMSYPFVYLIVYNLLLLILILFWIKKKGFQLNGTLYILLFLLFSGIISAFYWNASNGTIRNYSNLTLLPFIYLIVCYIITLLPILKYDLCTNKQLYVTSNQKVTLEYFTFFLIIVSFEPFLENLLHLPIVLANSDYAARMYENRVEYLSFWGRKLNRVSTSFELIYPPLLFYFLSQKIIPRKLILGLIMVIVSFWIHELGLGGRSKLVQNIFYLVVCFFLFKQYINPSVVKKIILFGGIFLAIGISIILIISISRFASIEAEGSNIENIWIWLGLYAGEGVLNFNSLMWYVEKSTFGDSTFIFIKDLLGLTDKTGVDDNWVAVSRLGIPGNVFYTYVGSIFEDFNRVGTLLFLSIFSIITMRFSKIKNGMVTFSKILILCLCARILVIPTFYTYTSLTAQTNLFFALCFSLLVYIKNNK